MTSETIEKIRKTELLAKEIEKSAVKSAELALEKAKAEAAEIIEKAKAVGEAYLREKSDEAQELAKEQSDKNQKKIDSEIKEMENAVSLKLGRAIEKIKEMLIK